MTIRTFITILALLFAGALSAEDSGILEIRAEYKNIREALPSLTKAETELSGYSTESGKATAYRDGKENRLIKVELYGESGKAFEEFYYQNGSLIFAFYESHRYNVPFNVTPEVTKDAGGVAFDPNKTKITEDRHYFAKGKLVLWIDENKTEIKPTSKEFKEREKDILKFSNELLAMFKQKT